MLHFAGHSPAEATNERPLQPACSACLILIGLVIVILGLLWPWLAKLPFGRLPGDVHIHRGNFSFFFPITTGIVVSVLLSLLLWLFRK